ncbi:arylesterase [Aquabacter spiritensis]|uniref:Acyl-CoA thioesterase-1 n=1 Tax=Aquabacter spiritensis TaxID=933073 RepID=A0A4R3M432_9HYPH|nr:arylesterase [Aquabacter spiritensis]TCT08031.1 acyl-CoA thioesterase-1 [Aquabacter spiritensis]
MAMFTIASGPAAAAPVRLVAFGDSLTAGYNLPTASGFAAKLEAALKAKGYDVTVVNAGVSGDTTAAALARFDWSIPKDADAVIVELGANDMLRGLDPDIPLKNLTEILTRLKARDVPVLLAGMRAAPNFGVDYQRRFDALYPQLAAEFGVPLYPFFLEGVAGNRGLNQRDGLHPTAAGVDRIVAGILPYVERLVASARAAAQ